MKRLSKKQEQELYTSCLEQAADRYMGLLSQERYERLCAIGFDWAHWENELDKLGFHWEKNNPQGVRYGKTV